MVDGYTVEEAASVLGVPRERVWELIARGILSASTDLGGAMRVRLKAEPPEPAPVTPVERLAEAPPPAFDMNPFRELLTEFRSLTERYGQALLALGEARGEVAGLRSRVDMLEARVDVHPSAAPPISSSWDASPWPTPRDRVDAPPEPVAPTVEPDVAEPAHDEPEEVADHAEDPVPHRRRGRRRATESFADALARADDPSPPELPGAAETAAALAGLRQEPPPGADTASPDDDDALLPREVPSADEMPVADEDDGASDASADEEPHAAFAEPPLAAADVDVSDEVERAEDVDAEPPPPVDAEAPSEPDAEQAAAASAEQPADDEGTAVDDAVETPADESGEAESEPPQSGESDQRERPRGDDDVDAAWDAGHYSTDIEEPGWISADDVAVAAPRDEPSAPAAPPATLEPQERHAPIASRWGSEPGSVELSGSRELDEALAALDALAHPRAEPSAPSQHVDDSGESEPQRPIAESASSVAAPPWTRTTPPPQLVVRSPASRAYRRLKRIFPT